MVPGLLLSQEAKPVNAPIPIEALNKTEIIGKLGHPIGKAYEIEGTVVPGSSTGMKALEGVYLLKVTSVAGKSLTPPVMMSFRSQSETVLLPGNVSELQEKKLGKKGEIVSEAARQKLEKDYAGSRVRFLAYESGRFRGIPNDLPADFPVWQDTGFGFQSEIVLLKKL